MGTKKEMIYSNSPIMIQKFLCNFEGKSIYKKRYSDNFFKKFDEIKYRDKLSGDEIKKIQISRLKRQLTLAYEESKYYKELFDECNFDPYTFNDLNEIGRLPVQTKDDMRKNIHNMYNKSMLKDSLRTIHTSGTTGKGLIFKETYDCDNERWAIWWRFRQSLGINFNILSANFGSKPIVPIKQKKPPFYREVSALKQVMFSMFHLNKNNVKYYVTEINEKKIEWIHGFPSIISTLASLMYENNLSFDHQIKFVTTGAEAIRENQKVIIRKVFGVEPIGHYGLTEPVANISVCEYGNNHVDEDFSYVEFIPIENTKNQFKLIGTSFSNDVLFFLRYDTNDIVTIDENPQACKCGREGRLVKKIEGRYEDTIHLLNGSKVWFLGDAFKDMVNVKGVQIYQYKDYTIDFNIIKNIKYSENDEVLLRKEIEKRVDCIYNLNYIDKLQTYKNNKFKFSYSELNYEEK